MRIEEERLDVMQNLEFAVASVYRRNPKMTDYAVVRTYEALLQAYSAEAICSRGGGGGVAATRATNV